MPNEILKAKQLRKAMRELPALLAQRDALQEVLAAFYRRSRSKADRERIEPVLPADVTRVRATHESWISQHWTAEAEHLKGFARKYRAGGKSDLARECEKEAQRCQRMAAKLRSEGK